MSPAEIDAEVARLSKELLALEEGLGKTSDETGGNSLDDQAIEENLGDLQTGQQIEQIRSIRERIRELEEERRRKKSAA